MRKLDTTESTSPKSQAEQKMSQDMKTLLLFNNSNINQNINTTSNSSKTPMVNPKSENKQEELLKNREDTNPATQLKTVLKNNQNPNSLCMHMIKALNNTTKSVSPPHTSTNSSSLTNSHKDLRNTSHPLLLIKTTLTLSQPKKASTAKLLKKDHKPKSTFSIQAQSKYWETTHPSHPQRWLKNISKSCQTAMKFPMKSKTSMCKFPMSPRLFNRDTPIHILKHQKKRLQFLSTSTTKRPASIQLSMNLHLLFKLTTLGMPQPRPSNSILLTFPLLKKSGKKKTAMRSDIESPG